MRKTNGCVDGLCNLVQMGERQSTSGDSGGPVYWGTSAYGIHTGGMHDPIWPFDRDIFSRPDRIGDALGIAIATV